MFYYQFNIGDYQSHTSHLSEIEDLTYRRLLDWYYLHECPIPLDEAEVSRKIRMRTHSESIAIILREYFEYTENGWIHHRANKEIAKAGDKSEKASASAKARWSKKDANALHPQSDSNATHNTLHNTQDTKHNSVSKDTGDKPPLSTDEIIFSYGVPLLTNAGTPEKSARSFLGGLRKSHGDEALVNTLRDCIKAKPMQPLEWLAKALPPNGIKKNPADIIHTTVPGTKELDPVLVKIMEDEKKAAPIPDFVRQFNKKIKGEA
jgi:uncharacterized protein YdaU (DUF1376 family)